MAKKFNSFYRPFLEKDEHKKSKEYKKLTPKMKGCLLYTSPSPRDRQKSRMPSSA